MGHQLQDQIPSTPTLQLQDKTKRRNWIVEMGSIHAQVQYARITRGRRQQRMQKRAAMLPVRLLHWIVLPRTMSVICVSNQNTKYGSSKKKGMRKKKKKKKKKKKS